MVWSTSIVFLTELFFNQSFKSSGPLKSIKKLTSFRYKIILFGLMCQLMRLLIVYGLCKRCGHWKMVGWSPGSLWFRESTESTVLQEGSIMKWEHANKYTESLFIVFTSLRIYQEWDRSIKIKEGTLGKLFHCFCKLSVLANANQIQCVPA